MLSFRLLAVIGRHLMRVLQYLIADESRVSHSASVGHPDQTPGLAPVLANPALSAGHDTPISIFDSQRVTTAEIVSPSSVTEHTTNLLDIK